jgi:hypothetical protein
MRLETMLVGLLLGLAGCNLTIDPNSVPPPSGGSCTPDCTGKACNASDGCTGVCTAACGPTHKVSLGVVSLGAGAMGATGGHSAPIGVVDASGAPGTIGATSGHSISQGTISP